MTDTIGYVRVSKEEQAAPDRTSLADQRTRLAALAEKSGRTIGQVFEDAGVSGGTAEGRPAFMALVAFCRDHPRPTRDGLVLVYNDSRWGRFDDPEESAYWRVTVRRHGWIVRFTENDGSEDLTARGVLRAIGSASASLERQGIKERARQGARGTAAQGFWGNKAAIGFRRLAIDTDGSTRVMESGKRKGDSERARLVPGPAEEVALIRWLFDTYATGTISTGQLATQAHTRWPGKQWSRGVLKKLLQNPAYAGDVVWCRRPADPEERRRQRLRPESEWVITRDAHPALIDRETFDRVQRLLDRHPLQRRAESGTYLLSAVMACAHCGIVYVGGGGKKGPPEDPERYRFYRHRGLGDASDQTRLVHACPWAFSTIAKQTIERAVVAEVGAVLTRPSVRAAIETAVTAAIEAEQRSHQTDGPRLAQRRATLEGQRDRLLDLAARGVVTDAEVAAKVRGIRQALIGLAREDQATHAQARRLDALAARRGTLLAEAMDFPTAAHRLRGAALRGILTPWIQSAIVDRDANELVLAIAPAVDAFPGQGLRGQATRYNLGEVVRIPLPGLTPRRGPRTEPTG